MMTVRWRLPLILSLALCLAASPAAAQERTWFAGLIGGATLGDYSNATGSTASDSKWNGTAGMFAGVAPTPLVTVVVEAGWARRGNEALQFDYLEIPLTVGSNIVLGQDAGRIRFYGGVRLAVKMGCSGVCSGVNSTEWSVPLGLMVVRTTADRMYGVDIQYSPGASDIIDGLTLHSRTWYFRALYGFRL